MWTPVNDKNGISSYEIARALGISQKSAWFILHRIRTAMQSGTFEKLRGRVEADETFIGGKVRNMHTTKRLCVMAASAAVRRRHETLAGSDRMAGNLL